MTAARWVSPMVGRQAGDILASARFQGSVSIIATPWSEVATRPLTATATIDDDTALLDYDQVSLVAGKQVQAIRVLRERTVPVHSGMFMAADAPLLAFVESADCQRFRLLVIGGELVGLVTLSDLQRLPVYSLLFGLAIAVEALLVQWIRLRCGADPDDWMRFFTQRERERMEDYSASRMPATWRSTGSPVPAWVRK